MDSNTMVIIVLLREAIPPRKNPNGGSIWNPNPFSVHVCTFFRKGGLSNSKVTKVNFWGRSELSIMLLTDPV